MPRAVSPARRGSSGATTLFSQTATLDAAGQRTVLHDSAGTTTYSYDAAGRLTVASYPSGVSEQDQYDAAGNRLLVTTTSPLSGTTVLSNTFDAMDEETSSVGAAGTTTYSYDGNGNQTGSSGLAGVQTTTFNQQNQLVGVTGPTTDLSLVLDGQGDRLRSYEQATPSGRSPPRCRTWSLARAALSPAW